MGKKLSISQPAVITTEITPLSDSLRLEANGKTEQWYYVNTNTFSPNRKETPLVITPKVSVVDTITSKRYDDVKFNKVSWKIKSYQEVSVSDKNGVRLEWMWWEDPPAVATEESELGQRLQEYDYVEYNNKLHVSKNNPEGARGITITCEAQYIDPRDTGTYYTVEKSIDLTTCVDATASFPTIQIKNPQNTLFNPLTSDVTEVTFLAEADWTGIPYVSGEEEGEERGKFVWYGLDKNGEEKPIEQLPYYISGQGTDKMSINPMYVEQTTIFLQIRRIKYGNKLLPPKVSVNFSWSTSPLSGTIVSKNGNSVRDKNGSFVFYTIVNSNHGQIPEDKIKEHLIFEWRTRAANLSVNSDGDTVSVVGYGHEIEIDKKKLYATSSEYNLSTTVDNAIYLLGAYEEITQYGEEVTAGGEKVFGRSIN
jgi:hypothetical protein